MSRIRAVGRPIIQLIKQSPLCAPAKIVSPTAATKSAARSASTTALEPLGDSEARSVQLLLLQVGVRATSLAISSISTKRALGGVLTSAAILSLIAAAELVTGNEEDKEQTWTPLQLQLYIGTLIEKTLNAAGRHAPELYDDVVNRTKRRQLALDSGALPESAYPPPTPGMIGTTLTGRYQCPPETRALRRMQHRTLLNRIKTDLLLGSTPAFLAYRPGPLTKRNRTKFYAAISFEIRNGSHLKHGEDTEPPAWTQGCVSSTFDFNYGLAAYATADTSEDIAMHKPLGDKQRQRFIEQLGGTFMISSTENRNLGYNLARLTSKLPKSAGGDPIHGESEYTHLLAKNVIGGLVDVVFVPGKSKPVNYVPPEGFMLDSVELSKEKTYAFPRSLVTLLQQSMCMDYETSDIDIAMSAAARQADPRARALLLISRQFVINDGKYRDIFFNDLVADDAVSGYKRSLDQQIRIYHLLKKENGLPDKSQSLTSWLLDTMPSIQHFCKARDCGEQFSNDDALTIAHHCCECGLVEALGAHEARTLLHYGLGLSPDIIDKALSDTASIDVDRIETSYKP